MAYTTSQVSYMKLKKEYNTFTLATGGSAAVTTGLRPIRMIYITEKDGTSAFYVGSCDLAKGSYLIRGTSTKKGITMAEGY